MDIFTCKILFDLFSSKQLKLYYYVPVTINQEKKAKEIQLKSTLIRAFDTILVANSPSKKTLSYHLTSYFSLREIKPSCFLAELKLRQEQEFNYVRKALLYFLCEVSKIGLLCFGFQSRFFMFEVVSDFLNQGNKYLVIRSTCFSLHLQTVWKKVRAYLESNKRLEYKNILSFLPIDQPVTVLSKENVFYTGSTLDSLVCKEKTVLRISKNFEIKTITLQEISIFGPMRFPVSTVCNFLAVLSKLDFLTKLSYRKLPIELPYLYNWPRLLCRKSIALKFGFERKISYWMFSKVKELVSKRNLIEAAKLRDHLTFETKLEKENL
eukprot:snap_masked-scaffold_1-processed-gene-16.39-mRNA-1 protein AED:1.00 eAED:1.00 QI:0/0/0/0/1/1/2/0/322